MKEPKFCKDCVHASIPKGEYALHCDNPHVVMKDEWALSRASNVNSHCLREREKAWYRFPACGKAGKLYTKSFVTAYL